MKDKIFIDSNIFLYSFDDRDKQKYNIAKNIVLNKGTISTQIINEVSINLLKKFNFNNNQILQFIESCYNHYQVATIDKNILLNATNIRQNYSISYYDSIIISNAINMSCNILYSEDLQHNQIISNLKIINPFI